MDVLFGPINYFRVGESGVGADLLRYENVCLWNCYFKVGCCVATAEGVGDRSGVLRAQQFAVNEPKKSQIARSGWNFGEIKKKTAKSANKSNRFFFTFF
jgi:hypothetical protein